MWLRSWMPHVQTPPGFLKEPPSFPFTPEKVPVQQDSGIRFTWCGGEGERRTLDWFERKVLFWIRFFVLKNQRPNQRRTGGKPSGFYLDWVGPWWTADPEAEGVFPKTRKTGTCLALSIQGWLRWGEEVWAEGWSGHLMMLRGWWVTSRVLDPCCIHCCVLWKVTTSRTLTRRWLVFPQIPPTAQRRRH